MPIALGETKTINYCQNSKKEYIFTVKWGEETNTCDKEGKIARSDIIPSNKKKKIIPYFIGEITNTSKFSRLSKSMGKEHMT